MNLSVFHKVIIGTTGRSLDKKTQAIDGQLDEAWQKHLDRLERMKIANEAQQKQIDELLGN